MKMYYIANARMPNEKAHGIQIAKMCEAFLEQGVDVTLVVPRRKTTPGSVRDFYHLRVDVPIIRLSSLNLYNFKRAGYFVSSLSFMLVSLCFLWWKKIKGEKFVVYTVDLDNYSSSFLPLAQKQLYSEMHGSKPYTIEQRFLFRRVEGIIAINSLIVRELQERFSKTRARFIVEPNGIDLSVFYPRDKAEARRRLGLPHDKKIALYAGRFFAWKGLEIMPQTARIDDTVLWYMVGGTKEEFEHLTHESAPANMVFVGVQSHDQIPWWLAAADALVVLGTKRDIQSYRYTSPMKLFEYLLSGRPIVASKTPALEQIVSDREVFFYEPDDVHSLAQAVHAAAYAPHTDMVERARVKGQTFSWSDRAKRVAHFIQEQTMYAKKI